MILSILSPENDMTLSLLSLENDITLSFPSTENYMTLTLLCQENDMTLSILSSENVMTISVLKLLILNHGSSILNVTHPSSLKITCGCLFLILIFMYVFLLQSCKKSELCMCSPKIYLHPLS